MAPAQIEVKSRFPTITDRMIVAALAAGKDRDARWSEEQTCGELGGMSAMTLTKEIAAEVKEVASGVKVMGAGQGENRRLRGQLAANLQQARIRASKLLGGKEVMAVRAEAGSGHSGITSGDEVISTGGKGIETRDGNIDIGDTRGATTQRRRIASGSRHYKAAAAAGSDGSGDRRWHQG